MSICALPGCEAEIDRKMLLCKPHWYLAPKPLRDALWTAYKSGVKYREARDDVIASVVIQV